MGGIAKYNFVRSLFLILLTTSPVIRGLSDHSEDIDIRASSDESERVRSAVERHRKLIRFILNKMAFRLQQIQNKDSDFGTSQQLIDQALKELDTGKLPNLCVKPSSILLGDFERRYFMDPIYNEGVLLKNLTCSDERDQSLPVTGSDLRNWYYRAMKAEEKSHFSQISRVLYPDREDRHLTDPPEESYEFHVPSVERDSPLKSGPPYWEVFYQKKGHSLLAKQEADQLRKEFESSLKGHLGNEPSSPKKENPFSSPEWISLRERIHQIAESGTEEKHLHYLVGLMSILDRDYSHERTFRRLQKPIEERKLAKFFDDYLSTYEATHDRLPSFFSNVRSRSRQLPMAKSEIAKFLQNEVALSNPDLNAIMDIYARLRNPSAEPQIARLLELVSINSSNEATNEFLGKDFDEDRYPDEIAGVPTPELVKLLRHAPFSEDKNGEDLIFVASRVSPSAMHSLNVLWARGSRKEEAMLDHIAAKIREKKPTTWNQLRKELATEASQKLDLVDIPEIRPTESVDKLPSKIRTQSELPIAEIKKHVTDPNLLRELSADDLIDIINWTPSLKDRLSALHIKNWTPRPKDEKPLYASLVTLSEFPARGPDWYHAAQELFRILPKEILNKLLGAGPEIEESMGGDETRTPAGTKDAEEMPIFGSGTEALRDLFFVTFPKLDKRKSAPSFAELEDRLAGIVPHDRLTQQKLLSLLKDEKGNAIAHIFDARFDTAARAIGRPGDYRALAELLLNTRVEDTAKIRKALAVEASGHRGDEKTLNVLQFIDDGLLSLRHDSPKTGTFNRDEFMKEYGELNDVYGDTLTTIGHNVGFPNATAKWLGEMEPALATWLGTNQVVRNANRINEAASHMGGTRLAGSLGALVDHGDLFSATTMALGTSINDQGVFYLPLKVPEYAEKVFQKKSLVVRLGSNPEQIGAALEKIRGYLRLYEISLDKDPAHYKDADWMYVGKDGKGNATISKSTGLLN